MIHKRIYSHFRRTRPANYLVALTKRLHIAGFEGLPLHSVLLFFIRGIRRGALKTRASALAFDFFLAIFPTIIFLFTLIPYIPIENFQENLLSLLKEFLPQSAYEATQSTIIDIVKHERGGLLSIGFIAALYFSTNGFHTMIDAFNKSYHTSETRTPLEQRMTSLLLVFIFTILVVIAIGLIIVSEIMLYKIRFRDELTSFLIIAGRLIIIFALVFIVISFMYYLGPAKKTRWKFFSAGSMFATILVIITSYGFAYYVNNFGQYNKLYGSIGTLIVIMLWIYFNSVILLLGFELNASIQYAKKNSPGLN